MTISIGNLQKDISILKKINEPLIVIDKRSKKRIAKILPLKEERDDLELFNKLDSFEKKVNNYTKKDFEKVYTEHLKEKYDIS